MFTERTHATPRGLRPVVAAVTVLTLGLGTLALAPIGSAGAQTTPAPVASPAAPTTDLAAAREVAGRRAAAHRRQSEQAAAEAAAFLADLAVAGRNERVAPVLAAADTRLGRPYVRGAAGPNAFDCSGFTRWAWEAAGVELPHYSGAQWSSTEHISVDDLQPGDLVFYWGPGERGDPSHVGLYVGDGQMIHAPGSGRSVRYESIWYWSGARVAAGRVG